MYAINSRSTVLLYKLPLTCAQILKKVKSRVSISQCSNSAHVKILQRNYSYKEIRETILRYLFWRQIFWSTLQRQYTENSKQIFAEMKLRGLVPITYIMFRRAIYIFPRSIYLFCCRKIGGPVVECINRSQIHECGNKYWGRAVSFRGIHKSDFLCSASL